MKLPEPVQSSIARKTIKLINMTWDKLLLKKYGKIPHVYSLPKSEYRNLYSQVCHRLHKSNCRLRRIGGYQLADATMGNKMSFDSLIAC